MSGCCFDPSIRARVPVATSGNNLLPEARLPQQLRLSCAVGVHCISLQQRGAKGQVSQVRPMAAAAAAATFSSESSIELREESDFQVLLSPDGYISICGFGSLLSGNTKEISSLSVEPCQGETLIITVFDIKISEVPSFIEREHEFRFLAVMPTEMNGEPFAQPAVVCARYSDEEYIHVRCKGGNNTTVNHELPRESKEIYFQRYGRLNIQKIWRDDILPCRVYLRHCVLAAKNLGEAAYENFLDHTFLADRKTTIRDYLSTIGAGIMEEEPPEALKIRYGG